jgi:hypothetical protein
MTFAVGGDLATPSEADIRIGVYQRQGGLCARSGNPLGRSWSCHHRRLRSGQGSDLPSNRIGLTGSGTTGDHGWVHANVREARLKGWLVSKYADPASQPVFIHGLGWVLLDDDFGRTPWGEEPPDGD